MTHSTPCTTAHKAALTAFFWLLGCAPKPVDIVFAKVTVGDVVEEVVASGTVSARTKVNVGSQISGTVASVSKDIGDVVRAGDVLAKLDTRMLDAQHARARATVQKAEAQKAQALVQLASAERALSRMQQMAQDHLAAQVDLDTAHYTRDQARAALAMAKAAIGEAVADVQSTATQKLLATLKSPIDGVIIDRQIEVGQTVAAQFQVATLFTIAQDMSSVLVLADIDEADMGRVRVTMPVRFFADAYPGRAFEGTLQALRPAPQTLAGGTTQDNTGVVTYLAEVAANNPDGALLQGMTVQVRIITARHNKVLRVPAAALRFAPKNAAAQSAPIAGGLVYIKDVASQAPGGLRATPAQVGLSDGALIEVRGQLAEGDLVAVAQGGAENTAKGRRGML